MASNTSFPRVAQLRIGRNESFRSSFFLGVIVPLFWLPSHLISAFASGVVEVCVGVFAIFSRTIAVLFQYSLLIAFGACGMVVAISEEEAKEEIQDEFDD